MEATLKSEWDMQVLPQDSVTLSQWGAAVGLWDSPGRGQRVARVTQGRQGERPDPAVTDKRGHP